MAKKDTVSILSTFSRISLITYLITAGVVWVMPFSSLNKTLAALLAILAFAVQLFEKAVLTSAPYETNSLFLFRIWAQQFFTIGLVFFTGGIASPFSIILLFAILDASFHSALKGLTISLTLMTYILLGLASVLKDPTETGIAYLYALPVHVLFAFAVLLMVSYLFVEFINLKDGMEEVKDNSKEKGEFIGLASHHLRTPLTGMKGYVNFLNSSSVGELNPQQKSIVTRLSSSMKKLEALVENLIMASSMENGKVQINKRIGDLGQVIRSSLTQYIGAIKEKSLNLVSNIPDLSGIEVEFDENRIREVFNNYIDNAIKFTEGGFVKVEVTFDDNFVYVLVADSGIGISDRELGLLFQKFARSSSVLGAWDHEGLGLGLYISRLIIEAHGGKVWVKSTPNKGSTFGFMIPRMH